MSSKVATPANFSLSTAAIDSTIGASGQAHPPGDSPRKGQVATAAGVSDFHVPALRAETCGRARNCIRSDLAT